MNRQLNQLSETHFDRLKITTGAAFVVYLLLFGYLISYHEMWGDEIHSWNIAKGSGDFFSLIRNSRYEGHPPVWYVIMWTISKFTHNLVFVQAVHWLIAALSVFLILFFSPIPFTSRLLLPFGYYFLFEYAVLSRNYAIAVLLTICICIIIRRNFRYKMLLYYILLYLLSNTHLLGILMAASLHLYFLFLYKEKNNKRTIFNIHLLLGILVILPAVYFIFPPSDSQLGVQFWLNRWGKRNFINFGQAPLRAFVPITAWWKYNFWNSQFLMDIANGRTVLLFVNVSISVAISVCLFFILKRDKKSLVLFFGNLLFSFIVAMIFFTLGSARYAGFLFISFVAAYWLYCYDVQPVKSNRYMVNGLLILQLSGSIVPIVRDIQYPFSNAYRVSELLVKVPVNQRTVTDYWGLNVVAAFADKPFYCIDLQKEIYFLKWDGDLKSKLSNPSRYTDGVTNLFQREGRNKLYLLSTTSPAVLFKVDQTLPIIFQVKVIDKIEGAIEGGSNLYLYEISKP